MDGRSAAADGTSQWITSPDARADVQDAARRGGRHHRRGRHRPGRRPAPDRPQWAPARWPPGSRSASLWTRAGRTPADARVRDGAARTWIATAAEVGLRCGRSGRPAQARYGAVRTGLPAGAAGGRADAGRRVPARGPGRRGRRATSRRSCSAAGRRRWSTAGIVTIAEAIDLEIIDVTRVGPDLRITALPKGR